MSSVRYEVQFQDVYGVWSTAYCVAGHAEIFADRELAEQAAQHHREWLGVDLVRVIRFAECPE